MIKATMTGCVGRAKLVTNAKGSVLNVNLASNRKIGEKQYTDWVSLKVWGERAVKLAPFIQKGTRLYVEGRPEARAYRKNDGTPGTELILHVSELEFLGGQTHAEETDEEADAELALETAGA